MQTYMYHIDTREQGRVSNRKFWRIYMYMYMHVPAKSTVSLCQLTGVNIHILKSVASSQ